MEERIKAMGNRTQNITSQELKNKNHIDFSQCAADFSNSTFWHYTSVDSAEKILYNHTFHCRNLKYMNDRNEANLHEADGKFTHVLCFCNSNTEKIPMWYLYAGITGKGISIGFTPDKMKQFIKNIEAIKGYNQNEDGTESISELVRERDFDIDFGWVFYRKKDERLNVFYKNQWFHISDSLNFDKENYFIKDYPWEYEREFRIVFRNKTKIPYQKIIVEFPEFLDKTIKIKLAPEFNQLTLKERNNEFYDYVNSKMKEVKPSDLSIKMNLINSNITDIFAYLDSISEKDEAYPMLYKFLCAHEIKKTEKISGI